jgi:mono/diheme cytochrome c family protein
VILGGQFVLRRRFVPALLFAALAPAALLGCGGEDLDTGPVVPPATEVVTDTLATTTAGTGTGGEEGDADAGKQVFASAGCSGCHTLGAANSSGTVGPNLDDAKPTLDEALTVITNGRAGMPSFRDQLSEQQIRDVATFVAEST